MPLNYWKQSWPLSAEKCPCDIHFFGYCQQFGARGKAIFHFGTGEHHYLGTRNMELDTPNDILGVTASITVYADFLDRI